MDDDEQDTTAPVAPARWNIHDYMSAGYILLRGIASAWSDAFEVLALTHMAASSERAEREEFTRDAGRWIETLNTTNDQQQNR